MSKYSGKWTCDRSYTKNDHTKNVQLINWFTANDVPQNLREAIKRDILLSKTVQSSVELMQSFWNTISKYPVFVAGAILGVLLNAVKPLLPLLKNPVTAIALVGAFLGSFAFVTFTLRAMLGLH